MSIAESNGLSQFLPSLSHIGPVVVWHPGSQESVNISNPKQGREEQAHFSCARWLASRHQIESGSSAVRANQKWLLAQLGIRDVLLDEENNVEGGRLPSPRSNVHAIPEHLGEV